jgi:hypothetical protein
MFLGSLPSTTIFAFVTGVCPRLGFAYREEYVVETGNLFLTRLREGDRPWRRPEAILNVRICRRCF